MERARKKEVISELNEEFNSSSIVVIAHYQGLTVADFTALRAKARASDVKLRVAKNTLLRLAANDTIYSEIRDLFTGPVAVASSKDPIAAAKVLADFSKQNEKLVIIGGSMDGKVLDVKGVQTLATLPSLDQLRAKIVGLVNAPATKLAGVVQAAPAKLARVINAKAQKA